MAPDLATRLAPLGFQPFRIAHLVDERQRYRLELPAELPMALHLFAFDGPTEGFPLNWHERLELFVPLEGQGTFCMGPETIRFEAGDLLVVDNMKLHGIGSFTGRQRRAMVVSFLPELVYRLGAPLCDATLLAPFYPELYARPLVVRRREPVAAALQGRLGDLAETYFAGADEIHRAGCRVLLLSVLYELVRHFGVGIESRQVLATRQEEAARLGRLHSFLLARVGERITVKQAGAVIGMGPSTFMRHSKRVTGERFLSYLTRLRMDRAMQLLVETNEPVALVADAVGFPDQAYFTRVFRRRFGRTPTDVRAEAGARRPAP